MGHSLVESRHLGRGALTQEQLPGIPWAERGFWAAGELRKDSSGWHVVFPRGRSADLRLDNFSVQKNSRTARFEHHKTSSPGGCGDCGSLGNWPLLSPCLQILVLAERGQVPSTTTGTRDKKDRGSLEVSVGEEGREEEAGSKEVFFLCMVSCLSRAG